MLITADQIVAHLVGDYIVQSDWMATEKTKRSIAAAVHVLCYSLPFLFLRPSLMTWSFIVVTHFVIDRWRLARYVAWVKNFLAPPFQFAETCGCAEWSDAWMRQRWHETWRPGGHAPWPGCDKTGYPNDRPVGLATWLLIITDNPMHLICNGIALKWM